VIAFVETGVGPEIDETGENVGKVPVRIDAAELAGLDQRSDDGPAFRAVVVAGEERVLSRESLRAHRAFDDVGVEIDAAVIEKASQALPVLERLADGLRDGGFGRHAIELFLEEAFERFAMRRGLLSAYGASFLGSLAPDGLFDPVERGNAQQRLPGNGSVALPGDLEEASPDMRPTEGERDRIVRQLLVRRVAVALHDATIVFGVCQIFCVRGFREDGSVVCSCISRSRETLTSASSIERRIHAASPPDTIS
jgi:hypothetical protein